MKIIIKLLLMLVLLFTLFSPVASANQTPVRINHLAWSPKGEYIAAVTNLENNKLLIYRTEPVAIHLTKSPSNGDRFLSVAWSPDGSELAVGVIEASGFVKVEILDSKSGFSVTRSYRDDEIGNSNPIQWQPTSNFLAIENYQFISILNANTMLLETTLDDKFSEVLALKFSPNGQFLASTHSDQEIRIWNISETNMSLAQKIISTGRTGEIAWKPDGTQLAVNDGNIIHIWDLSNLQQPIGELTNPEAKNIRSLNWADKYIAASYTPLTGNNGFIQIWDATTGLAVKTIQTGIVRSLQFSPDGTHIAYGDENGHLQIILVEGN